MKASRGLVACVGYVLLYCWGCKTGGHHLNLNPSHTWSFAFIGYHCSKYRFSLVRCFPALIGIVGTAVADTANISFSPGPAKKGYSDLGLWQ